jgi:asparagine synthase (glutamine-hydrolysing)
MLYPTQLNVLSEFPTMSSIIAVASKKEENAARVAVAMLRALKSESRRAYGMASPTVIKIEDSVEKLGKQRIESPTVVAHAFSQITPEDKPQPVRLKDSVLVFDGRIYSTKTREGAVEVAARQLELNPELAARTFTERTDADFAFAMIHAERIIAARDTMGVRPLYCGENSDFVAVASERKAFWNIGINKICSFPPGHVSLIDRRGFKFAAARRLALHKPRRITMQVGSNRLKALLEGAVKARVSGLREVSVAFSGGLDSSIIAFLAQKFCRNTILVHVSLQGQPDTELAERAAEELKLPLCSYSHAEDDLKKSIPKVIRAIEEPDFLKLSIGIPIYWAAEKTAELDCKVMLAGQGADELFGGYKRYVDYYVRHGEEKVQETIFEDIAKMYEANLERDSKICSSLGVELRLPFVTCRMAKFAVEMPLELKIEATGRTPRKLILRQVAKNLGLPQFIVDKPKKAIQYTTGVSKALKKIARQNGVSTNEYVRRAFKSIIKRN